MSINACQTIARQRWGKATAYRVGIVAGEIGARIVNPYRGHLASLYRQGLRHARRTRDEAATEAGRLGVPETWRDFYWGVMG